MALVVTSRGVGSTNTGGQSTLVVTPTSNLAAGSVAVLIAAFDNSGSAGANPFGGTISDSKGNLWAQWATGLNNPGINAGVGFTICVAVLDVSALTTSDTITLTFNATTVARAWSLYEITAGSGLYAAVLDQAAASQTSATPSITSSSVTNGGAIIGAVGREANGTRTADGDATSGTWTNAQQSGVGVTTAGMEIISESKVVSASAAQTYNPTFGGASADGVNGWISFVESARPALPVRLQTYPQLLPQ